MSNKYALDRESAASHTALSTHGQSRYNDDQRDRSHRLHAPILLPFCSRAWQASRRPLSAIYYAAILSFGIRGSVLSGWSAIRMYGPPPYCKRKDEEDRIGLRECIRPLLE
jgi:hypothetical protein